MDARRDPLRILIVDNEEGMLEVCQETLVRMGGLEVVTEAKARRAAARLETEQFALLITNLRMPGMSGFTLLRRARELDPDRPVLILTGYPAGDSAARCRELGAAAYLTKPFLPEQLRLEVRRALGQEP